MNAVGIDVSKGKACYQFFTLLWVKFAVVKGIFPHRSRSDTNGLQHHRSC